MHRSNTRADDLVEQKGISIKACLLRASGALCAKFVLLEPALRARQMAAQKPSTELAPAPVELQLASKHAIGALG